MDYTYLAIAGAVLLIFLSIYFFTVEKLTLSPFKGCKFVKNRNQCSGKGQHFVTYRSSITAPAPLKVDQRDFDSVCCVDEDSVMQALKSFQLTSMAQNIVIINERLGLKATSDSQIH